MPHVASGFAVQRFEMDKDFYLPLLIFVLIKSLEILLFAAVAN
jgi:hypothetical protein